MVDVEEEEEEEEEEAAVPADPGVQAIESNIVMSAIKDTTALPLELVKPADETDSARRPSQR